jgi:histone H3/H4
MAKKKNKKISKETPLPPQRSGSLPITKVRKIMKNAGADLITIDAVNTLADYLERNIVEITRSALNFTKHGKRKKLTSEDVKLSIKFRKSKQE